MITLAQGNGCFWNPQWVTNDRLWKYDRTARRLYFPDGVIEEFDPGVPGGCVTAHQDPFGNRITLTGWGTSTLTVTQLLGSGEQRIVTLENPSTYLNP